MPAAYPNHSPDVVAVLTVSGHNERHLRFAYPDLDIHRVYSGIDTARFIYHPLAEKKPQVAFVPKAVESLATLHHLIHARAVRELNSGSRFRWVALVDKSEREVAEILGESLLFVFLSAEEGLPRTPLEAMASGALTVTTDAGPLAEYVPSESRFAPGDLVAMAGFIEQVMNSFPTGLQQWEPLARRQRAAALAYSLERQERSVVGAWEEILRKQPQRRSVAVTSAALPIERARLSPSEVHGLFRYYRALAARLVAGNRFTCPFCMRRFGRFLPFSADNEALRAHAVVGSGFRPDARCPACNSRDRERLVYLYLRGPGSPSEPWRHILHIAPEQNLGKFLAASARSLYISGDLAPNVARTRFNLTAAPFGDGVFDLIVCNHVLGYIPDDRRAMRELCRMLAPRGAAILQVPIGRKLRTTYEDFLLTTDEERLSAFGDEKQIRLYGRDYPDRLKAAGFEVQEVRPSDWLSRAAVRRHALIPREVLFVCRRSVA